MGKPILFDTISRAKFDGLSDDVKAKRNYQIKEEDGTISKHIAGLEGGSGKVGTIFEFSMVNPESSTPVWFCDSVEEIDQEWEDNGTIKFHYIYGDSAEVSSTYIDGYETMNVLVTGGEEKYYYSWFSGAAAPAIELTTTDSSSEELVYVYAPFGY